MSRRKSRSEIEIEAQLSKLEPASERYRVLAAARDFRASWVQLGELLTTVREARVYERWGYASFEAYCNRELRLRRDTALKLTRSFSFLRDHEPDMLDEKAADEPRELPALDVVDLLSRARERAKISDSDFETVRQEVFAPDGPSTRNQVVRRLREFDPDAFKGPERAPKAEDSSVPVDLRKALLLAERLESLLEADAQCAPSAQKAMAAVVQHLRQRFESSRQQGDAA